jgi:hypothetical protein
MSVARGLKNFLKLANSPGRGSIAPEYDDDDVAADVFASRMAAKEWVTLETTSVASSWSTKLLACGTPSGRGAEAEAMDRVSLSID